MKRAVRLRVLPPYPFARWAARVNAARSQGLDVIRLDVGSPDLPPEDDVVDTLYQSARQPDHHGYPGYRGIPELRQAVADYYGRRFGVELDVDTQIVPLIGSKEGIVNLALACLDPGDLVLVPDPGYAPYTMGTLLAGGEVVTFPLLAENDFLPDLDGIPANAADRAVLMWLNYPNNPTGAVAGLDFFARAVDFCREHGILLCHDAPYCDVTYGDYVAPSLLQVPGAMDVAIEFNSLSKTANMAGWRLGVAVGNAETLAALAQVKSNVDSGIFRPLQEAAVRALAADPEWLAARNATYAERIDVIVETLNSVGMQNTRPCAALYVWTRVPEGWTSEGFAQELLEQTGVVVAPGPFFGAAGEGYVRLSITAPTERVREAMARLRAFTGLAPIV
jgi:LL-diaminopimelate aminotransferase